MAIENQNPHILSTSHSEELGAGTWNSVLNVETDLELSPDNPEYQAEAVSNLMDDLSSIMTANPNLDKISVTQNGKTKKSKSGGFRSSELRI